MSRSKRRPAGVKVRVSALWRRRWFRITAATLGTIALIVAAVATYAYISFAQIIDAQLRGERTRVLPRIYARPLELRVGQFMSSQQLIDRLNDLGYAQRESLARTGEFVVDADAITVAPRPGELQGKFVKVVFQRPAPPPPKNSKQPARRQRPSDRVLGLQLAGKNARSVTLDAALLSEIASERAKQRAVALSAIPPVMIDAVLAIEDRRYYYHPGIDPIRMTGAVLSSLTGRTSRISATSTLTQQLARNVFLPQFQGWTLAAARERSPLRKAIEIWISLVLTQRATKDEILEMYLNAVPLGQRGSFAIVGVSEAARLFFGKDVSNLTLAEAATIAGVIQSPSALSPFNNPARCTERRNVVLRAMADSGVIATEAADAAIKTPLNVVERALEAEAPHFVDYVGNTLEAHYPDLVTTPSTPVAVYTTLDLHLQRLAQDAVRTGLTRVDQLLSRRRRKGRAEAALMAVDPRTGDILAMVGGRSYNQSQFNRAVAARRQPGSVFKPFVFLTAFEETARGASDLTPATLIDDVPTTWEFDNQVWTPENYENEYDGIVSLRRALAHSRNIATIKVAEKTGYDKVAALWKRLGVGTAPRPFPSIALGVFEASPLEIATAYTIFPNQGVEKPLRHIVRVESGKADVTKQAPQASRTVARPDTTYLVTNMMRAVMNEGTGYGARSAGFTLEAAGKTGTTNDLRDGWFVGFTPELLTVVWVGFDDNQILGLSGAQAALPIWTEFMTRALTGRSSVAFDLPDGITFADIDPATGQAAGPQCPVTIVEGFLSGTEPTGVCLVHQFQGAVQD